MHVTNRELVWPQDTKKHCTDVRVTFDNGRCLTYYIRPTDRDPSPYLMKRTPGGQNSQVFRALVGGQECQAHAVSASPATLWRTVLGLHG